MQAKLRAAKHKAKKKGKQLVKKAKVILDRDAWWTSLGYDPEVKARSVRWCWRALFLLTTALVAAARTFAAPAAPVAFSLFRAMATNALFTASGYALITDTYRNPPPAKGSDSHYCSTYLGPYVRRADIPSTNRGDAAAATWTFRGDGDAAAVTWIIRGDGSRRRTWTFCGDGSRRRRGYDAGVQRVAAPPRLRVGSSAAV